MIHSVTITNPKGEALELELANPEKSGLAVSNIEGLGPPKATINGQEMATEDGMFYSSARAQIRNIIFTLIMMSRDITSQYGPLTIEESRKLTYRYFPLKKKIRVTVKTDLQTLHCDGYVESNDPTIFTAQEFATISVVCVDPYWRDDGGGETIFSGIRPAFEFPFSNESLATPLLEFGTIWLDHYAVLNYGGSVDTGILIRIHVLSGQAEGIKIYNVDTGEQMIIDTARIRAITGQTLGAMDDVLISTVKKDRYCRLLRNGVYTNIISALSRDSDWFQISTGANGFGFSADSGADNLSVTFSYQNSYVGI